MEEGALWKCQPLYFHTGKFLDESQRKDCKSPKQTHATHSVWHNDKAITVGEEHRKEKDQCLLGVVVGAPFPQLTFKVPDNLDKKNSLQGFILPPRFCTCFSRVDLVLSSILVLFVLTH